LKPNQNPIYSMETVEAIIADTEGSWKTLFKEMIVSMIATNKNELLWYANFLSRCEYAFHFNKSFVSAVYFNGNNFVIVINPLILGLIHKDQVIAILKHSAGHMINHHFIRNLKDESIDKEIIETAKDIVINGSREVPYIQDLPTTGKYKNATLKTLFYQTLTEKYGIENYETGRAFEYYVELILAREQEEEDSDEENASCSSSLGNDAPLMKGRQRCPQMLQPRIMKTVHPLKMVKRSILKKNPNQHQTMKIAKSTLYLKEP